MQCINHIDPNKVVTNEQITWEEFLKFLQREGERRSVITDTKMHSVGPKRLKSPILILQKCDFNTAN